MKRGLFTIQTNQELAPATHRMVLAGDTGAITAPGQFVNIALAGKFLRRPISVCDWDGTTLTLIYKVVGQGTAQMAQMAPGETLFLRLPSAEGRAFRHVQLALQMFPGTSPVKIRLMDTGKLLGTTCLLYNTLVEELRTYLGEENVVLR